MAILWSCMYALRQGKKWGQYSTHHPASICKVGLDVSLKWLYILNSRKTGLQAGHSCPWVTSQLPLISLVEVKFLHRTLVDPSKIIERRLSWNRTQPCTLLTSSRLVKQCMMCIHICNYTAEQLPEAQQKQSCWRLEITDLWWDEVEVCLIINTFMKMFRQIQVSTAGKE